MAYSQLVTSGQLVTKSTRHRVEILDPIVHFA